MATSRDDPATKETSPTASLDKTEETISEPNNDAVQLRAPREAIDSETKIHRDVADATERLQAQFHKRSSDFTDYADPLHGHLQKYWMYYESTLSSHHYAMRYDKNHPIKDLLLWYALDPENMFLLYGLLAFAAHYYSFEVHLEFEDFLVCYNTCIQLMQISLKQEGISIPQLLATLQLAAIEVSL